MKKFCILIVLCIIFVFTINKIYLTEDVEDIVSDDTQKKIEIPGKEAVPAENNKEEEMSQEEWEEKELLAAGKSLFETKCNKCHTFQSVLLKKKTLKEWNETVGKMQKKDFIWILPAEALTIADYLFKTNGIVPDTTSQQKK